MKIIKFEPNTSANEIFKELRGKPFFAASVVSNNDGTYTYSFYVQDVMPECVVFGVELLKQSILEKCK